MRYSAESTGTTTAMPKLTDILLFSLLAVSLSFNVLFAYRQHQQARTQGRPLPVLPKVGSQVPSLTARTLDGHSVVLSFPSEKPTLIYAFSPDCAWCDRNLEGIKALIDGLEGRYDIVGVVTRGEEVESYLEKVALDISTYRDPNEGTRRAYGFGPTPQTILLNEAGEVQLTVLGAYGADAAAKLAEQTGVKVPVVAGLP